jgi:hypothetical protein
MILIPEESSNNSFKFLESQISISNKHITTFMYSKNFVSLLSLGKPLYQNAQDFFSFTGEQNFQPITRLGTILGRLEAAVTYSHPKESLLLSFLHLYIQARSLQYPALLIRDACMKKYHSTHELILWKLLAQLIPFLENRKGQSLL